MIKLSVENWDKNLYKKVRYQVLTIGAGPQYKEAVLVKTNTDVKGKEFCVVLIPDSSTSKGVSLLRTSAIYTDKGSKE